MKAGISLLLLVSMGCCSGCIQNTPCSSLCSSGYKLDPDGCRTCECADSTITSCGDVDCGDDANIICKEFHLTGTNTSLARCVDNYIPTLCQMPADVGPCKAAIPMFWYDAHSDTCREFVYGGCQGNKNNFKTQNACTLTCRPSYDEGRNRSLEAGRPKTQCNETMCMMQCELGFQRDAAGCTVCQCRTTDEYIADCGAAACMNFCEHGHKWKEDGCQSCECAEAPAEVVSRSCGMAECMMQCEHGFKVDNHGCRLCECATTGTECGMEECFMECASGFKIDTNGCTMCECQTECSQEECLIECTAGFQVDENGCDVCACAAETDADVDCGQEMCFIECANGFLKDSRGCNLCKCVEESRANKTTCGRLMCLMECSSGFKVDNRGCPKCECNPEVRSKCPDVSCTIECEFGQVLDADGCKICECQLGPDPGYGCPIRGCGIPTDCAHGLRVDQYGCSTCQCAEEDESCPDIQCYLECSYGFVKNAAGCDICGCITDPCQEVSCGVNETCVPPASDTDDKKGTCVSLFERRPWCDERPSCTKVCPKGKEILQDGCESCLCRTQHGEPCHNQYCSRKCSFGYSFDVNGCVTCQCLENPCHQLDFYCLSGKVCEAQMYGDCSSCPYQPTCIGKFEVKRINLEVKYSAPITRKELHHIGFNAVNSHMTETLAKHFGVEKTLIQIHMTEFDNNIEKVESYVTLNFDLLTEQNPAELVDLVQEFEQNLQDSTSGQVNITTPENTTVVFLPQPESFQVTYHSTIYEEPYEDDIAEEQRLLGKTGFLIIGVIIGLLLALIVLGIILRCTSKKKSEPKYKKAPSNA